MIRKLTAIFALMLTLGLVVTSPVGAQEISQQDLEDMGLQSGYARVYMADPSAGSASTPTDAMGLMLGGFQFEDVDTAGNAFDDFSDGFAEGFFGSKDAFEKTDVDDLGDKAVEYTGEADMSGESLPVTLVLVHKDEYIFMGVNMGVSEAGSLDAIMTYMADQDISDTEVAFSDDGTSTGGVFDAMPQEGDELLQGMVPMADSDFMAEMSTPTN